LTLAYCIQHHSPAMSNPAPVPQNDPDSCDSPEAAPTKSRKISRRQFGRDAAMATAASLSAPALLRTGAAAEVISGESSRAQERPKTPPTQQKPGAETKPPEPASSAAQAKQEPLKGLTPKQIADVDAKFANILRKHPGRFSEAQKKRLRRVLAQQERLLAQVRAFPVQNGNPPASVLRVSLSDVVMPPTKKGSE